MKMPAPPPPPPPPASSSSGSAGNDQTRSQLLQSIRAGKALKKTTTVDKSAPAVSGRVKGEVTSSPPVRTRENNGSNTASGNLNNGGPVGLSGLFASGMPKLKPTGLRNNSTVERDASNANTTSTSHTMKRGPPPIPPPVSQKPQVFLQGATDCGGSTTELSKSFGKPSLAPKPPQTSPAGSQKPSPPPKKLNLTSGGSVSRAQSMRLPRSPPVLAPAPHSLHQSQDCLNETQPRPTNRLLRAPIVKPPSPPSTRSSSSSSSSSCSTTVTRVAPPPPSRSTVVAPCMPPPPPPPPLPHRPTPAYQRLAPPPPPPPTPPTRSSSMRNGQPVNSLDLELRFAELFHSIASFPTPDPFKSIPKVYSSRNAAKQQAPAPPLQATSISNSAVSLNTSSGG